MHDERQRHSRPARLPRRATDRVEDLVAWMLITLALLTAVVAATLALRLYGAGMSRADVETRERTQLQAVLLEQAPYALDVNEHGRAVRRLPVPVPARYTTPDGTERRADAPVLGPLPAGTTVSIWVDRSGTITSAPARSADAVASAAASGRWCGGRGRRRPRRHLDGGPRRPSPAQHGPVGTGVGAGRAAVERPHAVRTPGSGHPVRTPAPPSAVGGRTCRSPLNSISRSSSCWAGGRGGSPGSRDADAWPVRPGTEDQNTWRTGVAIPGAAVGSPRRPDQITDAAGATWRWGVTHGY